MAVTRAEREGALRLAYDSYLRADLCGPSPLRMRITPFHLLDSTDIIIAELRGEIISTLSLVRDGELGLPLETVYPGEVGDRRLAGLRMAEVSCLADRRSDPRRFFGVFSDLSRMSIQMTEREGNDQMLIAVHPRHARFYARAMGFVQVGDDRDYPAVNGNRAVLLSMDFEMLKTQRPDVWEKVVGEPLPDDVVRPRPISEVDRRYFAKLARYGGSDGPTNNEHRLINSAIRPARPEAVGV